MTVSFKIDGRPFGKERPRCGNGHIYTPTKTRDYERMVQGVYDHTGAGKLGGYINIYVTANFRIPTSFTKEEREKALSGTKRPGRPDIDNILKIIADSLNGYAYDDDSRVILMVGRKAYSADGDSVVVQIESTDGRKA